MTKLKSKPKKIRINLEYEDAEALTFERLKKATGIASNSEVVRLAVRQLMSVYNVRTVGE